MLRKLSAIKDRKNMFYSPEEDLQKKLYTLNMASRRQRKMQRDKHLQEENDVIIDRIIRARSYRLPNQESSN